MRDWQFSRKTFITQIGNGERAVLVSTHLYCRNVNCQETPTLCRGPAVLADFPESERLIKTCGHRMTEYSRPIHTYQFVVSALWVYSHQACLGVEDDFGFCKELFEADQRP